MFAIAEMTFRKMKEPAFVMMLILCVALGVLFSDTGTLSEEFNDSIVSQLVSSRYGYPVMTSSIFAIVISTLIAIFAGATDIPRDIETRMIMFLLTKPIRKHEYLIGKFIGILAMCALFFIAAQVTVFTTHYIRTGELFSFGVLFRQFSLIIVLFPLVGMTVSISCFVADFTAMILSAVYILFAVSFSIIPVMIQMLPKGINVVSNLLLLYYLFPNFVYYFQSFRTLGVVSVSLVFYSIAITTLFLCIASYRLTNRDLI